MDWSLIGLAGAGLFLAGVVKGATGLGYSSCALPFLVSAIGLKPAMVLVLAPAMATNIAVAATAGHFAEILRRFAVLYFAMFPGIAIGIALLLHVDQSAAVLALGCIIVTYALFTLLHPHLSLSDRAEQLLKLPTGFANGILTGLTGSQVMPLFPYMMALDLDPNRLVQAINMAVMLASLLLAAGLLATGVMTPFLAGGSVLAVAPALIGIGLGTRLRRKMLATQFRTVVLLVLLGMGAMMIAR